MAKKGMSGDMVLQIGLIAIAAFTTLMAVNLFYDSVEVSVFGDPYLAAKTMASYTDFVDASPIPMKIYHEIPQDFMGNPGYGSVLYDPETCEFKVNKYPQDYMSEIILNHAWDTVTLEEALSIYALNKWNKKFGKIAAGTAAKFAGESAIGEAMAKQEKIIENQAWTESIERQGYAMDDISKAAIEGIETISDKELRKMAPVKGEFPNKNFYWNEGSQRYHNIDGKFMTNAEGDKLTKEFLKSTDSPFQPKNMKYNHIDPTNPLKKVKNPNAQRNLRYAFTSTGIDPDGKTKNFWKLGKKELNVNYLKKVGDGKLSKAGFLSKAKTKVVKGSISLAKLPKAILFGIGGRVTANAAIYKKALTSALKPKTALKKLGKRLSKSSIRSLFAKGAIDTTNAACAATVFGAPFCYVATYGMAVVSYGLEYWLTYLPIKHFIDRSQDATNAINEKWSSVSCISKPKKVITTKPNCKSESDMIYPEFEDVFILGDIPIVEELAEAALAMPSSKPIPEPKEYSKIESVGEVCVDYHNYLLSDEVDIVGDKYINPREVVLTTPFITCGAVSAVYPGFGPGCTGSYAILYLSNWVNPEMGPGSMTALTSIMAFVAGPAAIPLTVAFLANPVDSTTFFPYISKSAGMINTSKYYYIENPYIISISKDYKSGEYVTEINKEL